MTRGFSFLTREIPDPGALSLVDTSKTLTLCAPAPSRVLAVALCMTTSRTHARTRLLALATGVTGASVAAYVVATERVRADRVERAETLPGDDVIPSSIESLTNAITIHRPPRDVWPWLAQMGAGNRAGWYSYDFIDNGGQPSAGRVISELQQLTVGMVFPALPNATDSRPIRSTRPADSGRSL